MNVQVVQYIFGGIKVRKLSNNRNIRNRFNTTAKNLEKSINIIKTNYGRYSLTDTMPANIHLVITKGQMSSTHIKMTLT